MSDFSYNDSATFTDWSNIGLYRNGSLVAGRIPTEGATNAVVLSTVNTSTPHQAGYLLLIVSALLISTTARLTCKQTGNWQHASECKHPCPPKQRSADIPVRQNSGARASLPATLAGKDARAPV